MTATQIELLGVHQHLDLIPLHAFSDEGLLNSYTCFSAAEIQGLASCAVLAKQSKEILRML